MQSALNLREPPTLEEADAWLEKRQKELAVPLAGFRKFWWALLQGAGFVP